MFVKLRIYRRPGMVVALLAAAASAFALAALLCDGTVRAILGSVSGIYAGVFVLGLFCLVRIHVNEGRVSLEKAERMLVITPHQDDGVICAGGFGAKNRRLGGETHVVYLVQPGDGEMRSTRREEAIAAWGLAGCPPENLRHLDLLPRKYLNEPGRIRGAAQKLQEILDEIRPTMVFVPLYEGGHVEHDIANYIMSFLVKKPRGMLMYECPEYNPYVSLTRTPHKILALLTRVFAGLVSYYGVAEGVDGRGVLNLEMNEREIELKRRMLRQFESQHGDALAANSGYPDRVIEWKSCPYRPRPFRHEYSLCRLVAALRRTRLAWFAQKLFPGRYRTYGLDRGITNLDDILSERKGHVS